MEHATIAEMLPKRRPSHVLRSSTTSAPARNHFLTRLHMRRGCA